MVSAYLTARNISTHFAFTLVFSIYIAIKVNAYFPSPFTGIGIGRYNKSRITCIGQPNVTNARVQYTIRRSIRTFYVGDSVVFKCLNGYKVEGNATVTCLPNGQWSKPPICDECLFYSSVEYAKGCFDPVINERCTGPPVIEDAYAYVGDNPANPSAIIRNYEHQPLSFKPFDSVIYKCAVMHEIVGQSLVICLPNGEWSQLPICKPNRYSIGQYCSSPPVITNGLVYMTFRSDEEFLQVNPCSALGGTFHVGETVYYRCYEGYALEGRSSSLCLLNNSWTAAPSCVPMTSTSDLKATIYCPTPPKPELFGNPYMILNGLAISLRSDRCPFAAPLFLPGSLLVFRSGCQISCQQDGKWTTTVVSARKNTKLVPGTAKSYCLNQPPYVRNARAYFVGDYNVSTELFGERLQNSPVFEVDEVVQYVCNNNYVLSDDKLSFVTCLPDGSWSIPPPMCKRKTPAPDNIMSNVHLAQKGSCADKDLPNAAHAEPYWKNNDDELSSLRTSETKHMFGVNDIVNYSCNCGYRAYGKPQVTCLANNSWSLPSFICFEHPSAKLYSCANPPLISGGRLFVTTRRNETIEITQKSYQFSSSILCGTFRRLSYVCEQGFAIRGNSTITCLSNGTWSQIPKCEQLPQRPHYRCTNPPTVNNSNGYYRWRNGRLVFVSFIEEDATNVKNSANNLQLFELYETISYTCKTPGYRILGSSISECQYNQTWSYKPICWPIAY